MIRSTKFATAILAGLFAALAVPAAAADALPCADYISTAIGDSPGMGQLIGTQTKTVTTVWVVQSTPGGIGGSATVTRTVSYEVGFYEMASGAIEEIDCRDYTRD